MVELELLQTLQSISYIAGATGVCIAALYYIQILRNAERDKRRQTLLMRMPTMNRDWQESYWYNYFTLQGDYTEQEWKKIYGTPEFQSKATYILSYYNMVGLLYTEGLMTIEDIVKVYAPAAIIFMFEKYWRSMPNNRFNSEGGVSDPGYNVPLERLYRELKRRYPGIESFPSSSEEREKLRKRKEETVFSKLSKEQFLASVMK